jgi:hypothetical protein
MKIDELYDYVTNNGLDNMEFEFTNLAGLTKRFRWLDVSQGLFLDMSGGGWITKEQWKSVTGDKFEFRISNIT